MDIHCLRISIAKCPCMDIRAWIFMWISTLVWIIEDWPPKIMDIHVDIRGFLEIHAWICYGFSDQGVKNPIGFLWFSSHHPSCENRDDYSGETRNWNNLEAYFQIFYTAGSIEPLAMYGSMGPDIPWFNGPRLAQVTST